MGFTYKAPIWNAVGVEPDSDLQNNGFQAGYKPPAEYFNYLFNQYMNCIDELQEEIVANKISTMQYSWKLGKGWYRIAQYKSSKASAVQGANANSVELIIKRMYGLNNAEFHHIGLIGQYQKSKFYHFVSASESHVLTKIRHVVDITNLVAYIDIYYNGETSSNGTQFILDNAVDAGNTYWEFITPVLVDEAIVDGQTVYSSMNIPIECTPATSVELEEIKNGTVENANTLGGHDSTYFAAADEVVVNNADFLMSNWLGTGWHRIAEYRVDKASTIQGANANSVELIIKRMYGTTQSEFHHIGLIGLYQKSEFYSLVNASNAQIITKIRHVVDTTNLVAYIDVYYTGVADSNSTAFVLDNAKDVYTNWRLITPTLVDETIADGQTIYSEMEIPANTNPSAYLPLTGGTLTGELHQTSSATGKTILRRSDDGFSYMTNETDDDNFMSLYLRPVEDTASNLNQAVRCQRKVGGTNKYFNLYGQHNITSGTTDLTAGTSELATGAIHLVYE